MRLGKSILMGSLSLMALLLAGCTGSPGVGQSGSIPRPSTIERDKVTIDYRGASLGGQIPEWVIWVSEGDQNNQLGTLPRLQGQKSIPLQNSGRNLDLLQSWVNLQAQGDVVARIKNTVQVEAGSALTGDKNTPENRNALEQFINAFSQASISGLERQLDFWIKERSKSTGVEDYTYFVVYGISEENFDYLVAQALGKVEVKSQEQRELKNEIESRMRQLRFSIGE